jgi:hypothetical protein
MADITVDISSDDDDLVTVANEEAFNWIIRSNGLTLEMRWEQFESFYNSAKEFFEESE